MSYIIKYVIEKLGDPIENIVCGAAIMISITSLVFLFIVLTRSKLDFD